MSDAPVATAAPYVFEAPLTVVVDVAHPLAWLTFGPVCALAGELAFEVDWLPLRAAPLKGPPVSAGNDRGTRHRQVRARYQASEIQRYAAAQGLTLQDPFRSVDSTLACLGHWWLHGRARERVTAYLGRLFEGYWSGQLDIERPDAIAAVLAELDQPADAFHTFCAGATASGAAGVAGAAALATLRERLVAAGVFGVPSLIVEEEVFLGRAHLPTVRWRLGGRVGPPPV